MKPINYLKLLLLMTLISQTILAGATDLPVSITRNSTYVMVTNNGSCPIYKMKISTIAPSDGLLDQLVKIVTATSFKKELRTLEAKHSFTMLRSELVNSDGKKLDSSYIVGEWRISGSYCGEVMNIFIKD